MSVVYSFVFYIKISIKQGRYDMAKQRLTKEFIKETVKQYDRVKANVKKVFDELGKY